MSGLGGVLSGYRVLAISEWKLRAEDWSFICKFWRIPVFPGLGGSLVDRMIGMAWRELF